MEILNKMYRVQYFPCVVSYFGQLISFSAESSSLDSEISQSLISVNENPVPSSKYGESAADVVKPATSYARSETSIKLRPFKDTSCESVKK